MKRRSEKRNWVLVGTASLMIVIGVTMMVVSAMYGNVLGVGSIFIGVLGLSITAAASMAIIKNDPSWILLDLMLPW